MVLRRGQFRREPVLLRGRPATHAVLAYGYDDSRELLFVRDPAGRVESYRYGELAALWRGAMAQPYGQSIQAAYVVHPRAAADARRKLAIGAELRYPTTPCPTLSIPILASAAKLWPNA